MKFHVELAVIITAILVLSLYFADDGATGFASTQVFQKKVDITIEKSQSIIIQNSAPFHIGSFTLTGDVKGQGAVVILIDNMVGDKRVVFSNIKTDDMPVLSTDIAGYNAPIKVIQGSALAGFPDKPEGIAREGLFQECGEACSIVPSWNQEKYILYVYVEQGTKAVLGRITYTS